MPPEDNDENDKKQAKKINKKQVEEMLGKDWHKSKIKDKIAKRYGKELSGARNFDFYRNPKSGNIYGKGNLSGKMFRIDDNLLK